MHFKTFISNLRFSGNHSIAMTEIRCFGGKQKITCFQTKKKWVSQNTQKGMVPWLEIYFFIPKTYVKTLNFVLKLRSLKKKKKNEIHTFWNGHKLKLVLHEHWHKLTQGCQQNNLQSPQEILWKFQLKVITRTIVTRKGKIV